MDQTITAQEIEYRLTHRRKDAAPLIPNNAHIAARCIRTTFPLLGFLAAVRGVQVASVIHELQRSKRDTQKRRDYNHRPDVKAKREAHYAEERKDGEKVAAQRKLCLKNYRENKPERNAATAKYYQINKEKLRPWYAQWARDKRETDINYRLGNRLRSRLWHAVSMQAGIKAAKTIELIGCSVAELRNHLQAQFKSGMSWDNIGEWHIDHKQPCSSFDLSVADQQKICFHYTNLQPLWAKENLTKSDKILV